MKKELEFIKGEFVDQEGNKHSQVKPIKNKEFSGSVDNLQELGKLIKSKDYS
jgi:hypothetical protein